MTKRRALYLGVLRFIKNLSAQQGISIEQACDLAIESFTMMKAKLCGPEGKDK